MSNAYLGLITQNTDPGNVMELNGNERHRMDKMSDATVFMKKCIEDGRVDMLQSILAQIASEVNFHEHVDRICCEEGTLLHLAVTRGSVDCTRSLLTAGVNPCVQNDRGLTAYTMATTDEMRIAFVQELLQATAQSNLGRVCQMISSGVGVNSVDSDVTENTALHWAASYGNEDVVRALCNSGAFVNAANGKGETALHDAVRRGNDAIVRCLLAHGADPSLKDNQGLDCYELATKLGGAVLPSLSMNTVSRNIRRSTSIDSEIDRSSIFSNETTTMFSDPTATYPLGRLETWTDLLWPQPKYINIDEKRQPWAYPKDDRLKVYFDGASEAEPRRIMQIIQISIPMLAGINLEVDYRGHKIPVESSLDGRVTCGIFGNGCCSGSYTLTISNRGIELFGEDYKGIRYGFATLVQILRIHWKRHELQKESGEDGVDVESRSLSNSATSDQDENDYNFTQKRSIPFLTIRDSPDMCFRAVFQDFSGCKILSSETLLQLATRIGYCKASHLFVNFEVRTTDRHQLPYTNKELFHMTQVCDELFVKLVPSLDIQASCTEPAAMQRIIECFLDDFPLTRVVHFGANLASMLITQRSILDNIQRRVHRIYISIEVDEKNAALVNQLPPYVTLCIEGRYPFEAENFLSPRLNVVLRFSASDAGYLCAAPESIAKKAVLAMKLRDRFPVLGSMMCDLSTGCEIMPPSLSYMSEIASVGVCWNSTIDMKKFCFLLPRITAEHFLLDGNMEPLFKQASTVGKVEHEITRFSCGLLKANGSVEAEKNQFVMVSPKKTPISVFVEMILNPDNMVLERLTPVVFKKARIELKRSLRALDRARQRLPYNYELALVLAEVQLVTELLVLTCKLGQSLCMHGVNPSQNSNEKTLTNQNNSQTSMMGYHVVNVGVANLPLTTRTDLANSLLEIRSRFQHTWLSRNIASTLPNALKIFDNLFRALLPPSLQNYEKNLL